MKIDPGAALAPAAATRAAQPFKQLLADTRKALASPRPVSNRPPQPAAPPAALAVAKKSTTTLAPGKAQVATAATSEGLQQVRKSHHTEAQRLSAVRTERVEVSASETHARALHTDVELRRFDEHLAQLLTQGLTGLEPGAPVAPQPQAPLQAQPPASKPELTSPEAKAAQAFALIEKIERFVRSQRPGLALTLNNSLGARVEIERIGPREIAVKLVGHRGPPAPEAVSRIRDELRARGLKVGALSVA